MQYPRHFLRTITDTHVPKAPIGRRIPSKLKRDPYFMGGLDDVQNVAREDECHKDAPIVKDWRSIEIVLDRIFFVIRNQRNGTCRRERTVSDWVQHNCEERPFG